MNGRMIDIGKNNINYTKLLNPIYIESIQANQIYLNDLKSKGCVKYKIKNEWIEQNKIYTRRAVLADSLFLRFIEESITRINGKFSKDFIILKFDYDTEYKINDEEPIKIKKDELRTYYYKNGVTFTSEVKDTKKRKQAKENERCSPIHYKMLMRSPGKAKDGECVFIRENLHHKAINFLTMGLYDLMDEQSKLDPDKIFKIVELSAYLTLTTAVANGYIQIPLNRVLVVPDEEVYSKPQKAVIVSNKSVPYTYEEKEFVIDFNNPHVEELINKKGFTFEKEKASETIKYIEKTKEALKNNGIRWNGNYGNTVVTQKELIQQECDAEYVSNECVKNVLWDGMGLIDESVFPKNMNGFIYCRSHFFKSCLFRGNIKEFFKDYCTEHNIEYDKFTTEKIDLFGRKLSLANIDVVITDKSLKWLKFIDMMGGTKKKAFDYYKQYMKKQNNWFTIVKTAHSSKWGDMQLMAYQMNNSLPSTDKETLSRIADMSVNYLRALKKTNDETYLEYLKNKKNKFNINEIILSLVKWNPDFRKTAFFRDKKTKDISKLKNEYFKQGRLLQEGDNLTVMGNPIALLMKAVGDNPLEENIFELESDAVQCYTVRFKDNERLASFRSPHNSPNNILHFHNVYSDKLSKYFANLGRNVIVINMIGTDVQARASGMDEDTDFVYTTNQPDLAELARKAYTNYPTIINGVAEKGNSSYHFRLEDFAQMDNQIAAAQQSIGTSTDTAQLALSYYYDEGMDEGVDGNELKKCFVILSVIGQISIDLAKKEFDIDVVNEINRIKRLPCMKGKDIPEFFANTKKSRNNKEFEDDKIRSMNCPMDIIAKNIDSRVIGHALGTTRVPVHKFFNENIKGKGNTYKYKKIIEASKTYNNSIRYIETHKKQYNEKSYMDLRMDCMNHFLNCVTSNLDQETVMLLVKYAFRNDNSDVCQTILNFLFRNHYDKFMNCFVKKC